MQAKLKQLANNKPVALSLAFGLIAATIITVSLAASPNASLEPESSSNRTNVSVGSDSSASNGQYVQFSSVEDDTTSPDTPVSWQSAWDARSQSELDSWYAANTGFDAGGYDSSTFWDISSDSVIDQGWLDSNRGNGHVSQEGDRWIIERVKSNRIRIGVDNVTVRGCLVQAGGGQVYGVQLYPTWSNNVTGAVVEYCTINGQNSEGTGILMAGGGTGVNTAITRYNDVYGWGTGIQMYGDITVQYSWAHDLYYYPGSHNASGSNRGANVRLLRNHFEDGSSAALSIYADSLIHNMVVEENLFNTPRAHYCINFASSKEYFDDTYDTHLLNNIFGQKYNPLCGGGGPMAGGNWTTRSGNIYMDGSAVFN